MPSRHEEKYIIDYRQYALLKSRAAQLLTPDAHGKEGSYTITSLYFDDPLDNALYEKLDGLPEHTKFRIRAYNHSDRVIKLERKDKRGILTEKFTASLIPSQVSLLCHGQWEGFSGKARELVFQMEAADLRPTIAVRYRRDAFFFPGTDLRLTFDTGLEAIRPHPEALFDPNRFGIPALDKNSVIMEIKYGQFLPTFIRRLTAVDCKQLSVSKYALCREKFIP